MKSYFTKIRSTARQLDKKAIVKYLQKNGFLQPGNKQKN